ncbi:MAG: LamG domain-containing protein [Archangiaceae bacterium]|nr:LamG domain-containing protein [Archangiaceae bacterium]
MVRVATCAALAFAATAQAGYRDVILASPGLLAYWPCDDASGPVTDARGNNPGTAVGGPTFGVAGALASGSSRALGFDGVDDAVVLDPVRLGTPTALTVETWVLIRSSKASGHYHTLVTDSLDDLNDGFLLGISAADQGGITLAASGGSSIDVTGTTSLPLNTWHHLAASYDPVDARVRLYVDGTEEASTAWSSPIFWAPARQLQLGRQAKALSQSARFLDGALDETALYGRALRLDEIEDHYRLGRDATPPDTALDLSQRPAVGFTSDDPDATFECRFDGGAWVACRPPYTAAAVGTLEVRAVDRAGNVDPTPASTTVGPDAAVDGGRPLEASVGCGCASRPGAGLALAFGALLGSTRRRRCRSA